MPRKLTSLPARGAWIEIASSPLKSDNRSGRSPQGERGLKFLGLVDNYDITRRSPQGERGLKSIGRVGVDCRVPSLPARGAWIEIVRERRTCSTNFRSLPARGAWIEILICVMSLRVCSVAPRKGSVD